MKQPAITVHKFALPTAPGVSKLNVPGLIKPLSAQWQHDALALWCLVDTDHPTPRELTVEVVLTGGEAEGPGRDPANFVDTVQLLHGYCVLHVFAERYR